jgi:MtN3 and saliva related transmembrane protein
MDAWTVLGLLAGTLTSSGFIPQIVKGFRTKRMQDVSLLMPSILVVGMGLWLIYGIAREDLAIIAANLAGCSFAGTIVAMKLMYDRKSGMSDLASK